MGIIGPTDSLSVWVIPLGSPTMRKKGKGGVNRCKGLDARLVGRCWAPNNNVRSSVLQIRCRFGWLSWTTTSKNMNGLSWWCETTSTTLAVHKKTVLFTVVIALYTRAITLTTSHVSLPLRSSVYFRCFVGLNSNWIRYPSRTYGEQSTYVNQIPLTIRSLKLN